MKMNRNNFRLSWEKLQKEIKNIEVDSPYSDVVDAHTKFKVVRPKVYLAIWKTDVSVYSARYMEDPRRIISLNYAGDWLAPFIKIN